MNISLGIFGTLTFSEQLIFCLRIFISACCGCIIGYERSRRLKGAGVRTHMVVAMSAALMTVVSKYGFLDVKEIGVNYDAARVAASIIASIPFLGTGVILVKQNHSGVQGLTTAAGMWATCGIGMAFGAGLYFIGGFSVILLLLLQILMHRFLTEYDSSFVGEIVILTDSPAFDADEAVRRAFSAFAVTVEKSKVARHESGKLIYTVGFKTKREVPSELLTRLMTEHPEIISIDI